MIAPKVLPPPYRDWNRYWRSPNGGKWPLPMFARSAAAIRRRGPFAGQRNSATRRFEYPWAYSEVATLGRGLRIVEVGGGLSGLQFVLAREGHHVINVDPGQPELGWGAEYASEHARMVRVFAAPVELRSTTLGGAGLETHSADVLLCISVLEHLSPEAITEFATEARRVIRPGGALILTVDLFLNIAPFSRRQRNRWGHNVDVRTVLDTAGVELVKGDPDVLNGFPTFSPECVLSRLERFLLPPQYPCLSQCVVARRSHQSIQA